jgi:hypothetical protein
MVAPNGEELNTINFRRITTEVIPLSLQRRLPVQKRKEGKNAATVVMADYRSDLKDH